MMHGHGLMVYADGSKYEGQFVQGKKCGHGTRFFSSGDHYIGQFRDNMMNGTGIYYSVAQQNKRQGEWLNGKRVSWLTAPQPYNVSIEEIRRDDQDLDRSSVRGTLYRGGKWRQVADATLSQDFSPGSRKLSAADYHLKGAKTNGFGADGSSQGALDRSDL